jgi:hypothetical protein
MARRHLLALVAIPVCAALAIVAHAVLPAKVDPDLLDGVLVQKLGFPIVAVSYFTVLFAHCAVVIRFNTTNIRQSRTRSGLLLGSAFALLYMVGMQEIMLDSSPFASWGLDFVAYQSLMGLGDAIPVIALCVTVSALVGLQGREGAPIHGGAIVTILLFTLVIGSSRLLWSYLGVIESSLLEYSAPVIAWGFALGCVVGIGWLLLERAYVRSRAVMLYGLGLNWVIFNMFMGLVESGAMLDALTRSLLDVAALAIAMGLALSVGRERVSATLTGAST